MKKPKITFTEFTSIIRGYYFTYNGRRIYNYQLYWSGYNAEDLINGNTKFNRIIRVIFKINSLYLYYWSGNQ